MKLSMTKDFLSSAFFILCLGFGIVLLYPVAFFDKGQLELIINQHHNPIFDVYFKYVTHLGDGLTLAILLIILLFNNYTHTIIASFSIVFQSIFVSIFKRWIFKGLERPLAFFDGSVSLNLVEGVDVHSSNTFPSGHTATGFALFALIFLILKNRGIILSTLLFCLALSVGFSRVYLVQHFLIDVYFGALMGIVSVILGLYLAESIFSKKQLESWSNRSLRNLISKSKAGG
jgi:membrane-associated phospholipid phosphatase